jgi:hypothetical protein
MLPADRREVAQKRFGHDLTLLAQGVESTIEIDGVPQRDGGGHQRQPASTILLDFYGAITQATESVETDGASESISGLALVQFRSRLPSKLRHLQPVQCKQRAFDPTDFAQSQREPVLPWIGTETLQHKGGADCAGAHRCGQARHVVPVGGLHTPIKRRGDMGYGLANIAGATLGGGVAEPVAVTTLDQLVVALGLSRVNFVKADIEGHEAALIAGARATLRRCRPVLLLEHDTTHLARAAASLDDLWADLVSQGYQPHSLVGGALTPRQPDGPQQGDVLWLP